MNLILGGRGYIATNLLKLVPDSIIYDKADHLDICDYDVLEGYIRGKNVETVYHLAAIPGVANCEADRREAFHVNVEGTFNVASLCAEYGKRLVFASSAAADSCVNFYGLTKKLGEEIVLHFKGRACRISNVWGGEGFLERKDTVVARLVKGTFEERNLDYSRRDYIHANEACRCLVEASEQPAGLYRIRTGHETYLKDLKAMSELKDFPDCLRRPGRLELMFLV